MAYRYECPVNDWFCPYFDNGECQLRDAPQECDAFLELKMMIHTRWIKIPARPGRLTNK